MKNTYRLLVIAVMFFAGIAIAEETGKTIEASAGKEFVITLKSNITTGYSWRLAEPLDKNLVQLVGSKYIKPEKAMPGAPGKEEWTFKAASAGKATISFEYVRPWENTRPLALKTNDDTRKDFVVIIK